MLKALQLIERNSLQFVAIETDNLYVVALLLEVPTEPSWQLRDSIMKCKNIFKDIIVQQFFLQDRKQIRCFIQLRNIAYMTGYILNIVISRATFLTI